MALTKHPRKPLESVAGRSPSGVPHGSRPFWHLLAGLAGLTGLATAVVALVILFVLGDEKAALYALAVGGGLALPATLWVLFSGVHLALSRRGAVGTNVAVQLLLATALLVGVNLFAFNHHQRWDMTWDHLFTIKEDLRDQLAQLRGETRIVMHLQHVTFGQGKEHQRDAYDAAAERKVLQKVKDLVEQFQELGPRFKVEVLDRQEEGYKDRLAQLTKEAPALGAAIERTVEDSIFFAAGDKVQSLSFAQLYQLDRQASQDADGKKGNLVLRPQGEAAFARRILNIEEKRPRLAITVFHGALGLESDEDVINMSGLKKALAAHGWEGRDIILKKFDEASRTLEAAALTYDDYRYEQFEEELVEFDERIKGQEEAVQETKAEVKAKKKVWTEASLARLNKEVAALDFGDDRVALIDRDDKQLWERRGLKVVDVAERHRQTMLNILDAELAREEARLKALREGRAAKVREMAALNVENLLEQRRITDVKAKLTHLLADCDLLVVPRFTFYNLARRDYIPAWRHGLEPEQVEAVKEFLKAGKPVLFCLGPANDDPDPRARRPPDVKPDALEPILADLGFKLPVQTVLYDAQAQAPTDRRASFLGRPGEVILPPVNFDWPAGTGRPPGVKGLAEGMPHPIRTSLRLNLGERGADPELRLRYPRPVYFEAPSGSRSKVDPVFLMSGPDSWNEKEPFPTGKRTPRFEAPKLGDPERGTLSEKRRGPLPIAAAAEVKVPAAWYADPKQAKERPTVRVAVIGQGTLLAGDSLSPAREKLVFDVANWLLGRDDSLSQDTQRWAYPRVSLKEQAIGLWRWGTLLGMPLLFIYFGCAMWMVRRLR